MEPVGLVIDRGVATITLQTPENRNALSVRLRTALAAALRAAVADEAVRAIVLTGAGPVFCAGADLKEAAAGIVGGPPLPVIFETIMDSPKPVVAVLNGPARAGGIGLVAAADIAVAPDDATFAFTEVRIGVIPAIISVPCLARMHPRAVARLFLTGAVFDASEAVASGLLTCAAPAASVPGVVGEILDGFRKAAPRALAGTKRLLAEVPSMQRSVAFDYADRTSTWFFGSDDAVEGRASFAEKRPPAWDISAGWGG